MRVTRRIKQEDGRWKAEAGAVSAQIRLTHRLSGKRSLWTRSLDTSVFKMSRHEAKLFWAAVAVCAAIIAATYLFADNMIKGG